MTDRTFTHAEVDTLLATERALVVQKAAEHIYRSVYGKCACGWSVNPSKKASGDEQWQQHIISLADQNLLQEHDAALSEALIRRCLLLERSLINFTHLIETMKALYSSHAAEWIMDTPAYKEARTLCQSVKPNQSDVKG